jgi:hypothetical protein
MIYVVGCGDVLDRCICWSHHRISFQTTDPTIDGFGAKGG